MEPIPLSGPQRDFLATYPHEVAVVILDQDADASIRVYANNDLDESHRELWVPTEGYIGQPEVRLHDPEVPDAM